MRISEARGFFRRLRFPFVVLAVLGLAPGMAENARAMGGSPIRNLVRRAQNQRMSQFKDEFNGSRLNPRWKISTDPYCGVETERGHAVLVKDGSARLSTKPGTNLHLRLDGAEAVSGDASFRIRLGEPMHYFASIRIRGFEILDKWNVLSLKKNGRVLDTTEGSMNLLGFLAHIWTSWDYELRVDFKGDWIGVYLDDELILQARDRDAAKAGEFKVVLGCGSKIVVHEMSIDRSVAGPPAPVAAKAVPAFDVLDAYHPVRASDEIIWPLNTCSSSDNRTCMKCPYQGDPNKLCSCDPWQREHDYGGGFVACRTSTTIYDDAEAASMTFDITLRAKRALSNARVRFELIDYYEKRVGTPIERTFNLTSGTSTRFQLTFGTGGRRGSHKIRMTELSNGNAVTDLLTLAVIPRHIGERPANPDSPFGGHINAEGIHLTAKIARLIGMRWVRLIDHLQLTWWNRLEWKEGCWLWDRSDCYGQASYDTARKETWATFVNTAKYVTDNRLLMFGSWLKTPEWYLNGDPTRMPDFGHLTNYAAQTASTWNSRMEEDLRASGTVFPGVNVFEVWNEPSASNFLTTYTTDSRGSPYIRASKGAEYAELCKAAYRGKLQGNPSIQVAGGGGLFLPNYDWNAEALKAGLSQCSDLLAVHYTGGQAPMEAAKKAVEYSIHFLRTAPGGVGNKKIWSSEDKTDTTSFLDQFRVGFEEENRPYHFRNAAESVLRLYVVNLSVGIEKTFHYYMKRAPHRPYLQRDPKGRLVFGIHNNQLDFDGGVRPMTVAYATAVDHLEYKKYRSQRLIAPQAHAYFFENPNTGEVAAVYWANYGQDARVGTYRLGPISATSRVELIDVMNNPQLIDASRAANLPLSRTPYILRVQGASLSQVIAAFGGGTTTSPTPQPTPQPTETAVPVPVPKLYPTSPKTTGGSGSSACRYDAAQVAFIPDECQQAL